MTAQIFLNYTERSHVLTGDFDGDLAFFRNEILKKTQGVRRGCYSVGRGWCFSKKRLTEIQQALQNAGIDFEQEETPEEKRGAGRTPNETSDKQEVVIHLDYTPKSHVLTGPFWKSYPEFKAEVLQGKSGFRGGRFRVGSGWVFSQTRLEDLEDALKTAGIPYRKDGTQKKD